MNDRSKTKGCHHIGLSVNKLEESARFFTKVLGWHEIKRDDNYPAIFISDNSITVSLWQSHDDSPVCFDKDNIGLHHVAFIAEPGTLADACWQNIPDEKINIGFPPELLRDTPAKHMICYEPSGIRVELSWPGVQRYLKTF